MADWGRVQRVVHNEPDIAKARQLTDEATEFRSNYIWIAITDCCKACESWKKCFNLVPRHALSLSFVGWFGAFCVWGFSDALTGTGSSAWCLYTQMLMGNTFNTLHSHWPDCFANVWHVLLAVRAADDAVGHGLVDCVFGGAPQADPLRPIVQAHQEPPVACAGLPSGALGKAHDPEGRRCLVRSSCNKVLCASSQHVCNRQLSVTITQVIFITLIDSFIVAVGMAW